MMQEVGSDDTNGESTFEFVEGSVNPSETIPTSSHSIGPGNNINLYSK